MGLSDTSNDEHLKTSLRKCNIIIRSRVMAEALKLKKTGSWFIDHKRANFQYFYKRKKLHTLQLHTCFEYELQ